jgi:hypothetical protein
MTTILNALTHFFKEDQWNFTQLGEQPILQMGFEGQAGQWGCYAQAREREQQFVFYSVCRVKTPAERLSAMAEFLTRANYNLIIGNFELDYTDGEVRFKTSIDVEGDELTWPLIHHIVYANVLNMDKYLPGIMAVIERNATPQEAIELVER